MAYEDRLNLLLEKAIKKVSTPGIALGLSINGDHYFSSKGFSDLDKKERYNIQSRFKIGKLLEIFISILYLQMTENETFHHNDPIEKHLDFLEFVEPKGKFIRNMRTTTLKDILVHTSGLGDLRNDGDQFIEGRGLYPDRNINDISLKQYYNVPLKQIFSPQSQWYYSPHNYGLIATAIEEIQQKPIEVAIREKILIPLKLNQTSINNSDKGSNLVIGYKKSNGKFLKDDDCPDLTFLYLNATSSIQDLLTLFDELNQCYVGDSSILFKPSTMFNMFSIWYQPHSATDGICLPFRVLSEHPLIIEYSSTNHGNSTRVFLIPAYRISLVLTSNSTKYALGYFYLKLLDIILSDLTIKRTINEKISSVNPGYNLIETIAGVYRPEKPNPLNSNYMKNFGNDLFIRINANGEIRLKTIKPNIERNSEFRGGKRLKFIGELDGALLYNYKSNGNINKLIFPKSQNPGYIYLQEQGPIILYRSKFDVSATRYFGLVFFVYFSKLKHEFFIPAFRKFGNFILSFPAHAWLFLIFVGISLRHFIMVILPKYSRVFNAKLRLFLAYCREKLSSLYVITKRNWNRFTTSFNEKISPTPSIAKFKISNFLKRLKLKSRLSNVKEKLIPVVQPVKPVITKSKKWLITVVQFTKINLTLLIISFKKLLNKIWMNSNNIGKLKIGLVYQKLITISPKNFQILENKLKSIKHNMKLRRINTRAYNSKYPRQFRFNSAGINFIKRIMRPPRKKLSSRLSNRFPKFYNNSSGSNQN